MRRSTLLSRFLSSWQPADLSSGLPGPPPTPNPDAPDIDPPSLCEAGPCRHYHRLATVMEVQPAIDGTTARPRQITRACYPAPGVEIELAETPVLQCSRWNPAPDLEVTEARRAYAATDDGCAFIAAALEYERALGIEEED